MHFERLFYLSLLFIFFLSCGNKTNNAPDKLSTMDPVVKTDWEQPYLDKGAEVSSIVFKNLSGKLKSALTEQGVVGAVKYCNLAASPLVDSLSTVLHVDIRRTSHKTRNSSNAPTELESSILSEYLSSGETGEMPAPKVIKEGDEIHYFAPIFLMDNCLKCHGTPGQEMANADYKIIRDLYPQDEAVGFSAGDLRGIWSLTFGQEE